MTAKTIPMLVEPDWLAAHLSDPDLRILDCTVQLLGRDRPGPLRRESGRSLWESAHIPGSAFVDLMHDLSDPNNPKLAFPMPSAEQFAEAMGRLGVGDDSKVVLYDSAGNAWAARVWWMLRAFGFERAGVLNGGWARWTKEGRPVSSEPPAYPPAHFTARPHPDLIAQKDEVLAAIGDGQTCIVNALSPAQFAGTAPVNYARPGHIPSSVNVPSSGPTGVFDPEALSYRSPAELQKLFATAGVTGKDRVITYCGGGIAASSVAFALTLLGVENVAVYDGSLTEWAADPSLPLETD
jgi:thiosulfate/3-mercaptopyruvate sulfurtransferase